MTGAAVVDERPWHRVVPLAGVSNLRDLGDYATADGRRVRRGRLYRSAALDKLTDADADAFVALGLRTICDFRSPQEREAAPYRPPSGCRATVHSLAIVSSVAPAMRELMNSGRATPDAYRALLTEGYRSYVRDHAEQFRALFACLLDEAAYPVLFHCAAGKDRTGMAAVLVLSALGVDRATVEEDYLLTNVHWNGSSVVARSAPPDLVATIVRADSRYLAAAFDAIEEDHGTIDTFLHQRLGIGAAERAALQRLLLA
jgi:protein-tyrosine phosphatase